MVEAVKSLLASYDELPTDDQRDFVREVLRRVKKQSQEGDSENVFEIDQLSLDEDELTVVADAVFQMYDEEERSGGTAQAW